MFRTAGRPREANMPEWRMNDDPFIQGIHGNSFYTLFDDGYLTITTDYKVEVIQRLHNDYGNGKDYYRHHGQPLLILPGQENQIPSKEYLEWHNEHIYLG